MGCRNAYPNGDAAYFEQSDSVLGDGCVDFEFFEGFLDDALPFFVREGWVGGVFEAVDGLAFVVVANPAFEGGEGAGVALRQGLLQLFGLKRIC